MKRIYGNTFSEEFIIEDYELYGEIFENDNVQSIEEVSVELTFEFMHDLRDLTINVTVGAVRVVWMDWEGNTDLHVISSKGNQFDTFKSFKINENVRLDEAYQFVIDADNETLTILETN